LRRIVSQLSLHELMECELEQVIAGTAPGSLLDFLCDRSSSFAKLERFEHGSGRLIEEMNSITRRIVDENLLSQWMSQKSFTR
jgi:hypothetical protein